MKASGLRGRVAALAFRRGIKWSFMPKPDPLRPSYLVVNADESEPGTCKDREIMRNDPHLLIEGCMLACVAMQAHACYIYIRGEYILEKAPARGGRRAMPTMRTSSARTMSTAGPSTSTSTTAPAPIFAVKRRRLLESLEGKKGMPRLKPPFPANMGLYGCPTTVNNVESIAVAPTILRRGAAWFAGFGAKNNAAAPSSSASPAM